MDLQIDYAQTRSLGNSVTSKGTEFASLLSKINTANNNLKSYWKGTDASKYTTAVEQQAAEMDKLKEAINEIGAFLVDVANAYEKVNETNQQGISMN